MSAKYGTFLSTISMNTLRAIYRVVLIIAFYIVATTLAVLFISVFAAGFFVLTSSWLGRELAALVGFAIGLIAVALMIRGINAIRAESNKPSI